MLEWGIHQTEHPVAIRVPANGVLSRGIEPEKDYGKLLNRDVYKRQCLRSVKSGTAGHGRHLVWLS